MAASTHMDRVLAQAPRVDGYWVLTDPAPHRAWAAAQWRRRARENRLYSDPIALRLPEIHRDHPLAREWGERADTLSRLATHLSRLWRSLTILDVGCGCGWLSHQLAAIRSNVRVFGLDLDPRELKLASRVFLHQRRVRFLCADALTVALPPGCVDVVVLAATLDQVADPAALLARAIDWLAPDGELHIVDSAFANAGDHASSFGALSPGLLAPYRTEVLYDPKAWRNRLAAWWWGEIPRMRHPWIKITRPDSVSPRRSPA